MPTPPGDDNPRHVRRRRLREALPHTALGLAGLLFMMAVTAAFTGTIFYAYYDYRSNKTEERVDSFISKFKDNVESAKQIVDKERDDAKAEIRSQLDDLEKYAATGETLGSLIKKTKDSVWFVETLDESGAPAVGSAFVAFADGNQSFLLTSYTTIRAATRQPGPDITVRKGDERLRATVHGWDDRYDLALLVVDKPNLPRLEWAGKSPPAAVGDRLFAMSGLGSEGASITQGFVADVSAQGIQHDVPVGPSFQGGPLINSKGEVVAVASRSYAPLGFGTDGVFFGVPIRASCDKVLRCPDEGAPGAGG
jgi:S1-C subfamily serine protease